MRPTKVYSAPRLSHLLAGFTLVRLTCGGFLLCLATGLPGGLATLPPWFHLAGPSVLSGARRLLVTIATTTMLLTPGPAA